MYAVIANGGKQYRVEAGDKLRLEKLEHQVGDAFDIPEVLMVGEDGNVEVGTPLLDKAVVKAEVISHGRAKKINIIKFKRRKKYMRRQGHRQYYTEVEIKDILKG